MKKKGTAGEIDYESLFTSEGKLKLAITTRVYFESALKFAVV